MCRAGRAEEGLKALGGGRPCARREEKEEEDEEERRMGVGTDDTTTKKSVGLGASGKEKEDETLYRGPDDERDGRAAIPQVCAEPLVSGSHFVFHSTGNMCGIDLSRWTQ